MSEAPAHGVRAHRDGANDDDSDSDGGAGNRLTKRNVVRARPGAKVRFTMFAAGRGRVRSRRAMMNEDAVMRPNVPVEGRAAMACDKLKSFPGASPRTPGWASGSKQPLFDLRQMLRCEVEKICNDAFEQTVQFV